MAGWHHGGSGCELWEMVRVREAWCAAFHGVSALDMTGKLSSCISSCFTACVGFCCRTRWLGCVYMCPPSRAPHLPRPGRLERSAEFPARWLFSRGHASVSDLTSQRISPSLPPWVHTSFTSSSLFSALELGSSEL